MGSQFVPCRANQGSFLPNSRGKFCRGTCSMELLLPGLPLPLSRPQGALQTIIGRHMRRAPLNKREFGAPSLSCFRSALAPIDGIPRHSIYTCRRQNGGTHGRKTLISALSNLKVAGLRQTSNASADQDYDSIILDVQGMKSGDCVARVRSLLAADMRVNSLAVSLITKTAAIRLKPSASLAPEDNLKVGDELASHLTGSGFTAKPRPAGKAESSVHRKREEFARKREEFLLKSRGQVAFAWGLGALCFGTHAAHILQSIGIHAFMDGMSTGILSNPVYKACISFVALLGPGRDLLVDGVKALWRKSPNINSLVGVGASAFCAISAASLAFPALKWDASSLDEPVMLLAVVLLGLSLDGQARAEASSSTHDLLASFPFRSRLVVSETETGEPAEDETGRTQGLVVRVVSEQLRPGDCVLVLPGETIPVDGKVIKGKSVVDESMIVGKPLSVRKFSGHTVSAGTVNWEGPLTVEATATGAHSTVSKIIKLVEEAQSREAPFRRLADVIPGSSALTIMAVSAATFFFWYYVGANVFPGRTQAGSGGSALLPSLQLATDVFVVACFCALGLATPTTVLAGKSVGTKKESSIQRGDIQKRSAGLDPMILHKDEDTVEGKDDQQSPTDVATAAATVARGEDISARKDDASPPTYDYNVEQFGTRENIAAGEVATMLSTDDSKAEQSGASVLDLVPQKDDAGPLPVASDEDVSAQKDEALPPTDSSKLKEPIPSDTCGKEEVDECNDSDKDEKAAKKEPKKREPFAAKSGRKRPSKEEGEGMKKTKKKKKDPNVPKRGLSAFMFFSQSTRENLKKSQPGISFSDTGKVLGEMWKQLSEEEKAPYQAKAEADQERYKREMLAFNRAGSGVDPTEDRSNDE